MSSNGKKIVIIGGGIAGLCTAVYALKCGYEVEVLEMHDMAGGLAMSWRRGPYTFETCLHWLVGSNPGGDFHSQWQEIFDIGRLTFINPEEFVRIATESGDSLTIYTNVDRLEEELLRHAPQDAAAQGERGLLGELDRQHLAGLELQVHAHVLRVDRLDDARAETPHRGRQRVAGVRDAVGVGQYANRF